MNRRNTVLFIATIAIGLLILGGIFVGRQATKLQIAEVPTLMVLPTLTHTPQAAALNPTRTPSPDTTEATSGGTSTPAFGNPLTLIEQWAEPTVTPVTPKSQTAPIALAIPAEPVTNQIVLTFKPSASAQERASYIRQLGGTVVQEVAALNSVAVTVPAKVADQPLPASTMITASEPDYWAAALVVEANDPLYGQQWSLPVIGAADGWAQLADDTPTVIIAVIDSGVCAAHPDLSGRILPGYDFVSNDTTPQDDFGHGCSVIGIIAANTGNTAGIAGIAPNAQIMPLRVLDERGLGTYSNVAAAIVYAADHGAQIINLSLGGSNSSAVLQNAVSYAATKGVLVIAAAGNTGGAVLYPAAYDAVVGVAAVDSNLQRSSFSSYGPEVDLLAPGRDILTTTRDGGYALMTGTSFAAPEAAGIAALQLAFGKSLTLGGSLLRLNLDAPPTPPSPTPPNNDNQPPAPTPPSVPVMRNPAAVYCTDLGYQHETVPGIGGGEDGMCILPDGQRCEQWQFYAGQCGQQYSYCAQQGLGIVTLEDGKDPFAPVYAACTDAAGQVVGTVNELSSLGSRALDCYDGKCQEPPSESMSLGSPINPAEDWISNLSVPPSFDWRSYQGGNWLTGVRNQGNCGSCWAFAAVGAAEAALKIGTANVTWNPDLSEQYLVSTCATSYGVGSCSGGNTGPALQFIKDNGIVDEACMYYEERDLLCSQRCSDWNLRLNKITDTSSTWGSYYVTPSYIKQNLIARGPVVVYMGIGYNPYNPAYQFGGYFDGNGIFRCTNDYGSTGNSNIDHAVVAVGYNDTERYWIIRNSWGSWWNGDGYFKVGYGECNIDRTLIAWAMEIEPPTPLAPANGAFTPERSTTFSWQAGNSLLKNGVNLRISNNADPNSGNWLLNTTTTNTSYTYNFTTSGTYYWHISTATASANGGTTSNWITRQLIVNLNVPSNDNFANATIVAQFPSNNTINTRWATTQAGETPPSCSYNDGKSVWYKYYAPYNDSLTFNTSRSDFNTVLSVWRGTSLTNLTEIACDDQQVGVTVGVTPGMTYYIRVSGDDNAYGNVFLDGASNATADVAGLIAAIEQANFGGGGTIYLKPNTLYEFNGHYDGQNALPLITANISIYGNNATIARGNNALQFFRLFEVAPGARLYLHELTLKNGMAYQSNGGAVLNHGTLSLFRATMTENHATYNGGAVYSESQLVGEQLHFTDNDAGSDGGAIYTTAGSWLDFFPVEFARNQAINGSGGAIFHLGGGMLGAATFTNNSANYNGGGISSDIGSSITIFSSKFENNRAPYGGGIDTWGQVYLSSTEFKDNKAATSGGGLGVGSDGRVDLYNCRFENNQATEDGGGLNTYGTITDNGSTFIGNLANNGGGIHVGWSSFTNLRGSFIRANTATEWGGGIRNWGDLTIYDALISDNRARSAEWVGVGGGIANSSWLEITHSVLSNNLAVWGGAIYNDNGWLTADNLHVRYNSAKYGAGIYNNIPVSAGLGAQTVPATGTSQAQVPVSQTPPTLPGAEVGMMNAQGGGGEKQVVLYNNILIGNNWAEIGGGIYNFSGTILLSDARFDSNSASKGGGIFANMDSAITLGSSHLTNNSATFAGGGIENLGTLAITDSTFSRNQTWINSSGGGAIMNSGNLTATNAWFTENHSENNGGALFTNGTVTIDQSNFLNNSTYYDGGAIWNSGTATLMNTTVQQNTAGYHGGGIANHNAPLLINGVTFDLNHASYQGGGVYYTMAESGAVSSLVNTQFNYNTANEGGAIFADSTTLALDSSCLVANSPTAVLSSNVSIMAQNNWWGAADGPSGSGPGSGDSVNASVDYSNFSSAPLSNCAPSNDDFDHAYPIRQIPYSFGQSTYNALHTENDPKPTCTSTSSANTVWYAYTPTVNNLYRVDTAGSGYDTLISVWTGTRGHLTAVKCHNNVSEDDRTSQLEFNATAGRTYYIMVSDQNDQGGNLSVNVRLANDTLADVTTDNIKSPFPFTSRVNTVAADFNLAEPTSSCAASAGKTVWYRYTLQNRSSLYFTTAGSDYIPAIGVWKQEPETGLTAIACDYDTNGDGTSLIDLQAEPGIYYILVADPADLGGNLVFKMQQPLRVPTPIQPLNNGTVTTDKPTFSWNYVSGAVRYEMQISDTLDFTRSVIPVYASSYLPTMQLLPITYYWQVRAVGAAGNVTVWSDIQTFSVISAANAAPGLNLFTDRVAQLSWGQVSWAIAYEIQLDRSSAFTTYTEYPIGELPRDQFSVTTPELDNGLYYWRVRAQKPDGSWGAWSSVVTIVINAS